MFLDHTLIKVFLDDMQTESPYGVEVIGSVAEWSIAPVLKTGNGKPFVSSNLTASANTPMRDDINLSLPPKQPP